MGGGTPIPLDTNSSERILDQWHDEIRSALADAELFEPFLNALGVASAWVEASIGSYCKFPFRLDELFGRVT